MATALRREQMQEGLHASRELHGDAISQMGRAGKMEAEELNRQHMQAREAWKEHGRNHHHVHKNDERVRLQLQRVMDERSANAAARAAQRREGEMEKAREIAARILTARARANRNRRSSAAKIRSSSNGDLQVKRTRRGVRGCRGWIGRWTCLMPWP